MNKKPYIQSKNILGDFVYSIQDNKSKKLGNISFDFACSNDKKNWAQQTFVEMSFILHRERSQPILVTNIHAAKTCALSLRAICEDWENFRPHKPMWNWTLEELTHFFWRIMPRKEVSEQYPSPIYSNQRFQDLAQIFNVSHKTRILGKSFDGLSFTINFQLKISIMEPLLDRHNIPYAEWRAGKSYPAVPLGICSVLLMKAIHLVESYETSLASVLYRTWRKNPQHHKEWISKELTPLDLVALTKAQPDDRFGLIEECSRHGIELASALPWSGKKDFRVFRRRLQGACINVLFIQSGHRGHEFISTVSNDRKRKNGRLYVKQRLGKSLDGLKVYRPYAELSARAAEVLWGISYIDPDLYPLPLQHAFHDYGSAKTVMLGSIPPETLEPNNIMTLNKRINSFYKSDVLSIMEEAKSLHPSLSTHQFRHSFAEFCLRRFDEDVHESLREHFVHKSDYATQVYERIKLDPSVQSMLERNYLLEIIGKAAEGKLESKFWGPAFARIHKEVEKIKFLYPSSPEEHYRDILTGVERFAVFEWGFCVLFTSSKHEANCLDSQTGLPDIDSLASVSRCTTCPNNMGNSIQKQRLLRTELAFAEAARAHPIKAVGKLFNDIAFAISHRTKS